MKKKNILLLFFIVIISLFCFNKTVKAEEKTCTMSVSSAKPSTKESGKMSVTIYWNCASPARVSSFTLYDSKDEAGASKKNRVKIPDCVGSNYTCKPLTNVQSGSWELYNLEKNHDYFISFKYKYSVAQTQKHNEGATYTQGPQTYEAIQGMTVSTKNSGTATTKTATAVISTTTGHNVPETPTTSGENGGNITRPTVEQTSVIENPEDICDDALKALIHKYWNYIMLLAPVLLIALMTIDGIKCVSSGTADKIKKYSNDAVKRVIATLILLALPGLISMIMNMLGLGSKICF